MMYTFTEITGFKLDDYIPHIGWIGKEYNPYKIYTMAGSGSYYLHDEIKNRLYEFTAGSGLNSKDQYNHIIDEYLQGH